MPVTNNLGFLAPVQPEPTVSVVMPVRDGERWLESAVESVLGQTLTAFELIVVDDGSIDRSFEIMARLGAKDSRIRVFRHDQPRGLVEALNRGLAMARAPLVARLDADDLAVSTRLSRQVQRFSQDPALALLGSWAERIDAAGRRIGLSRPETDADRLARDLVRRNPFIHSSIMMRSALVRDLGGYRNAFTGAEDFDLWLRLSEHGKVANAPEILVRYRVHEQAISRRFLLRQCFSARLARSAAILRRSTGTDPSEKWSSPPDWWESEALTEFYADDVRVYRFLDCTNAITNEQAAQLRLPNQRQLIELSHAERKLAQKAIVKLLAMPKKPTSITTRALVRALLFLLVGRTFYRPAAR